MQGQLKLAIYSKLVLPLALLVLYCVYFVFKSNVKETCGKEFKKIMVIGIPGMLIICSLFGAAVLCATCTKSDTYEDVVNIKNEVEKIKRIETKVFNLVYIVTLGVFCL